MIDSELLALLQRLEERAERTAILCELLTGQLTREREELAAIRAQIAQVREQAATCPGVFWTNPRLPIIAKCH